MGINHEPSPAQAGVSRARSALLICVHLFATDCSTLHPFFSLPIIASMSFQGKQVDLLSTREGEMADLEKPQLSRQQCWLFALRDKLITVRAAVPSSRLPVQGGDAQ